MKILILGANGFIGSHLCEHVLAHSDWHIAAMDLGADKLAACLDHPRFTFEQGDIRARHDWVEAQVREADAVLPLAAIATPSAYIERPLQVFELAFEANLAVVRLCLKHGARVIFPSTSEVYGMCEDAEFDEETSNLVLGPIHRTRWIYSCSKQMMDRVIYAYGAKEGLRYSIFRPFNWMGPRLDDIRAVKQGSSRALTQFIGNVMRGEPIRLVAGGQQRRCFLYIADAVDALMRILENRGGCADQGIFNLGNPQNDITIKALAQMIVELMAGYPQYEARARQAEIIAVPGEDYYGEGYQDAQFRVPSIRRAREHLGWQPQTDLRTALKKTLDYYLL